MTDSTLSMAIRHGKLSLLQVRNLPTSPSLHSLLSPSLAIRHGKLSLLQMRPLSASPTISHHLPPSPTISHHLPPSPTISSPRISPPSPRISPPHRTHARHPPPRPFDDLLKLRRPISLLQMLLEAPRSKFFSTTPASMRFLSSCFPALSRKYPHAFLHLIKSTPLQPEPEVLGDMAMHDVLLPKLLEPSPRATTWHALLTLLPLVTRGRCSFRSFSSSARSSAAQWACELSTPQKSMHSPSHHPLATAGGHTSHLWQVG